MRSNTRHGVERRLGREAVIGTHVDNCFPFPITLGGSAPVPSAKLVIVAQAEMLKTSRSTMALIATG
jgi:hypothetical protein